SLNSAMCVCADMFYFLSEFTDCSHWQPVQQMIKYLTMEAKEFLNGLQPMDKLKTWVEEAKNQKLNREPTPMVVSTTDHNGQPSSRIVLLKKITPDGLVFYTNYLSHKGNDLADNAAIAVNFFWESLSRQINIEGRAEKTSRQDSEAYWQSRPRQSQLSQYI